MSVSPGPDEIREVATELGFEITPLEVESYLTSLAVQLRTLAEFMQADLEEIQPPGSVAVLPLRS